MQDSKSIGKTTEQPVKELKLGLGFLPTPKLEDKLVKLSNDLAEKTSLKFQFTLGVSPRPHLSLFHSRFTSFSDLDNRLAEISSKLEGGFVDLFDLRITPANFVFVDVGPSPWLLEIHKHLLTQLEDLIVKPETPVSSADANGLTDKQIEYYNRYRYPYLYEYFNPHITLGRLSEPETELDLTPELEKFVQTEITNQSFRAAEISVFEVGKNGMVPFILSQHELK